MISMERLRRPRWHPGQLLAFSGLDGSTDYDQGLTARTAEAPAGIEVKLPGRCRLAFPSDLAGQVLITSDLFDYPGADGRTRGAFLDAHHLLVNGPCLVSDVDPSIRVLSRDGRTLVGSAICFRGDRLAADLEAAFADRSRWLQSQSLPAGLPETSFPTFAKALAIMKGQVYSPEGAIRHRWTTPDRWPHRAMWLWDSVFHAIGWRHLDGALARDALAAVFDCQAPDGFIPLHMTPTEVSRVTQPPIIGLGVASVSQLAPDPDWLEALYPGLGAYVAWDLAHRDPTGNGLVAWQIEANPTCRSGESGMDNSPRFDDATLLEAVDFNAFLASECDLLADLALRLGRADDATRWRQQHRKLCGLINKRLWSEEAQFYLDYDLNHNRPSPVLASSGFLPLCCGAASPQQAEALVRALDDPERFGTPLPVPSIAASDRARYAKDMWRGPVWVNVNWLIAEGLDRYGFHGQAARLRRLTRLEIERHADTYGTLFEFFDDRRETDPPKLLRKGRLDPTVPGHQVLFDYGWTATLYVDLAFREFGSPGAQA
jgi:hypothetical protein